MKKIMSNKKAKIAMLVLCGVLILAVAVSMITNTTKTNSLKDSDKAVEQLLSIFYTNERDEKIAEALMGKSYKDYFSELEKNSYDATYESLKDLREGVLLRNKTAEELATDYTNASLGLLKQVKDYKITDKQEVDNGYRYTIEVTPADLSTIYQESNSCASYLTEDMPTEDPDFAAIEGHEYAIYYYCLAQGMSMEDLKAGEATTINIIMNKQEDGTYAPDEASLLALISVVF